MVNTDHLVDPREPVKLPRNTSHQAAISKSCNPAEGADCASSGRATRVQPPAASPAAASGKASASSASSVAIPRITIVGKKNFACARYTLHTEEWYGNEESELIGIQSLAARFDEEVTGAVAFRFAFTISAIAELCGDELRDGLKGRAEK